MSLPPLCLLESLVGQTAAGAAPAAASTGDVVGTVLLIGFCAGFVVLAFLFLRKKRQQRLAILAQASTEASELHDLKAAERALTEGGAQAIPENRPRASELVDAEREVQRKEALRARKEREVERLEADAAKGEADAEAKLAEAQKAAADAADAADAAKARAAQLNAAMKKTRDSFVGRLGKALGGGEIDDAVMDEVESILFTSDIGARTADQLLSAVKKKLSGAEKKDAARVHQALREEIVGILEGVPTRGLNLQPSGPTVVMIIGVNGAGKTTSIGKLTHRLKAEGKSVLLGAGDTFRAAATEQLEVWAERNGCDIVKGKEGADPASVLFDAVTQASKGGIDVVLCDTAGRLHTKTNLMEELKKVERVLGKAADGAPHEALLVLDATVGQNAIQQAKQFGETVPITGIVLTKLDGTAKGGVIIGMASELKIPVKFIGVGEQLDDLRPFDPTAFVDALFGDGAGLA